MYFLLLLKIISLEAVKMLQVFLQCAQAAAINIVIAC